MNTTYCLRKRSHLRRVHQTQSQIGTRGLDLIYAVGGNRSRWQIEEDLFDPRGHSSCEIVQVLVRRSIRDGDIQSDGWHERLREDSPPGLVATQVLLNLLIPMRLLRTRVRWRQQNLARVSSLKQRGANQTTRTVGNLEGNRSDDLGPSLVSPALVRNR